MTSPSAELEFSGRPCRAVALRIPLETLNGAPAPAYAAILIEVDADDPTRCQAFMEREDAFGIIPTVAKSVAFPTSLLSDVHTGTCEGAPDLFEFDPEGEDEHEDQDAPVSPELAESIHKAHLVRLVRLGEEALDQLSSVYAAARELDMFAEVEEALAQRRAA